MNVEIELTKIKSNENIKPYKEKEYREYLIWKSLPSFLFKTPEDRLDLYDLPTEVVELLKLKTKKEFQEHFGLVESTLWRWDNETPPDEYKNISWKSWARKLTKNVMGALYRQALIDGDAARAKFWFQVVEDWSEKSTIDLNAESLNNIEILLKDIVKRGQDETTNPENAGGIQEDSPPAV